MKATNPFLLLSEHEFERRLTPEYLKASQIIQAALMAGVLLYAGTVLMLYFQGMPSEEPDVESLNTLSILDAVFALSSIILSAVVHDTLIKKFRGAPVDLSADLYLQSAGIFRTAMIVRMAILEGSAFFGLAVSLIAVTGGVAATRPEYLLNMLPSAAVIVAGIVTFPSRDRLVQLFVRHVQQS